MVSHPSRGAWIEIEPSSSGGPSSSSRTPRGVRGLKLGTSVEYLLTGESHPSRGAWIEILSAFVDAAKRQVAPLAGCVD